MVIKLAFNNQSEPKLEV